MQYSWIKNIKKLTKASLCFIMIGGFESPLINPVFLEECMSGKGGKPEVEMVDVGCFVLVAKKDWEAVIGIYTKIMIAYNKIPEPKRTGLLLTFLEEFDKAQRTELGRKVASATFTRCGKYKPICRAELLLVLVGSMIELKKPVPASYKSQLEAQQKTAPSRPASAHNFGPSITRLMGRI